MYRLPASSYDCVRPFFPQGIPGRSFVAAHLEHNHAGAIYADNLDQPETILVALACDYTYVAGTADNRATNQALTTLLTVDLAPADGYALVFPTTDAWQRTLEELFDEAPELYHAARVEYHFDPERFAALHGDGHKPVPEGTQIRRYDRELAEATELPAFWGSVDAFLQRGFGVAVVDENSTGPEDRVISRCHTVMIGDGEAEISIETAEPYRRRGLATAAACAVIRQCRARNLVPAWSCWDDNTASQHLAESLGFVHHADTPALVIKIAP